MVDKSTKSPNFYDLPRMSDLCARCKGYVAHDPENLAKTETGSITTEVAGIGANFEPTLDNKNAALIA